MREPMVKDPTTGAWIAYSLAPVAVLQCKADGGSNPSAHLRAQEWYDPAFRRWWAAQCLAARGL